MLRTVCTLPWIFSAFFFSKFFWCAMKITNSVWSLWTNFVLRPFEQFNSNNRSFFGRSESFCALSRTIELNPGIIIKCLCLSQKSIVQFSFFSAGIKMILRAGEMKKISLIRFYIDYIDCFYSIYYSIKWRQVVSFILLNVENYIASIRRVRCTCVRLCEWV